MGTIFARLELSKESVVVQYVPEAQRKLDRWHDVVLYYDRAATHRAGVIPASYTESRLTRRHKYTNLNCVRYHLVWLEKLS